VRPAAGTMLGVYPNQWMCDVNHPES